MKNKKWSFDEIVVDIFQNLSVDDKRLLLPLLPDNMYQFHFTVGMNIRNDYNLWWGNTPEGVHPDDYSHNILIGVLRKVKLEALVNIINYQALRK